MQRVRVQRDRTQMAHIAAPIMGMDTVSAGVTMPAGYSIYSYNLIGAEYGLRSRLGWREWVTGLGGEQVRSLLPFTGSLKNGSSNRLFACTASGIWDVSASTTTPTMVVSFNDTGSDAGFGTSTVFVNSGGHFLAYTDEANGYYVYSETNGTWVKVVQASSVAWVKNTAIDPGSYCSSRGLTYYTSGGGTTEDADDAGPSGTGASITDGTVTWAYTPSIGTADPSKFAFVVAWKNRLWFVERDTSKAWYLGLNAIYGNAVSFNFGARFKAGGDLRGLWSWTYDGGSGIDDALVAVSGGGDVVVYKGTDPSSAQTFGLSGVWYAGAVPAGRKLCTDFGGDLLFMSSTGIQSMSKLVTGGAVYSGQYETAKIANLFAKLQAASSSLRGWSMRLHPKEAALMVIVPVTAGSQTQQLVMSTTTKGWHQYRDMPMGVCAEPWNGTLYFGTEDGRVCMNDGEVDGVLLSDPNAYKPVYWSALTGFTNMNRPTQKQVHFIRPTLLSNGGATPHEVAARYRWNLSEIPSIASTPSSGGARWGSALWDQAVWGGSYTAQQRVAGAYGMGPEVAIAIRGASSSRMTLTGIDVNFEEGSFL